MRRQSTYLHQLAMRLGSRPRLAFMRLIQGGLLFLFGSLILILADRAFTSSIQQELIALFGMLVAAIGILWALVGYISMSIFRIYHMLNKKDED